MKISKPFILISLLFLFLVFFNSCKRTGINEPSPFGPSAYSLGVTFELYAQPNVIYCTSTRPQSLIKAVLKKNDGSPLVDRRVFFSVLSGPGTFENGTRKTYVLTDSNGIASTYYVGPTFDEISHDQFAELKGQPETSTPFYMHKEVKVRLIRGE